LFNIQPKDNKIAANEVSPNHFGMTLGCVCMYVCVCVTFFTILHFSLSSSVVMMAVVIAFTNSEN